MRMKRLPVAGLVVIGSLLSVSVAPVAAQHAPIGASSTGPGVIEVPLRVEGGRLLVPVTGSDGSDFVFALTTGNPMTILTESTAAALAGSDGRLTLGGVPLELDDSVTLPDEQLAGDGGRIQGMVGAETLSDFDVLIDAPNGRLLLKPTGREVAWAGVELSAPTRLQLYHGVVIALQVGLNGAEYRATLDLGTPAVIVNSPVGEQLNLESEDTGTLALGTTTMTDLPVRVRDLEILDRFDPAGNGFVLVGAPIAYDCAISISWLHRELRTCAR